MAAVHTLIQLNNSMIINYAATNPAGGVQCGTLKNCLVMGNSAGKWWWEYYRTLTNWYR